MSLRLERGDQIYHRMEGYPPAIGIVVARGEHAAFVDSQEGTVEEIPLSAIWFCCQVLAEPRPRPVWSQKGIWGWPVPKVTPEELRP